MFNTNNSYNKQTFSDNFLNLSKPYSNQNQLSIYNQTKQNINSKHFPESFNLQRFENNQANFATIKSPIKNFGIPKTTKEDKLLTKDEMKMLIMDNRFKKLEQQNQEDKNTLLRFINSGLTAPINTLLQYHHIREQEDAEKKEIENRREYDKKELKRAQEQLKRELEFSSDDSKDDFNTKAKKVDKRLKKQLGKQKNGVESFNHSKALAKLQDKNYLNNDNMYKELGYSMLSKNPIIENAEKEIKYLDVDYERKVNEVRKNNKRAFADVKSNFDRKIADMSMLLERMEQKNLMAVEFARNVFENSGSKRLKFLSKRILGGEEDAVEEEADIPDKRFDPSLLVNAHDDDVDMLIDKKKNNLPDYIDALNKKYNDMSIEEWKQKRKDNLKEQIIKRQLELNKDIEKKLNFIDYESFELKPKNKLKVYINAVKAASRMINIKYNSNALYKLELLKTFVSYYETVNSTFEKWVFASIKTPYYSIYNFSEIDLRVSSLNDKENIRDYTYIAIETRIKGMISAIIDHTNTELMDINLLKLLSIISTNGMYVPLKFYYNFELSRMNTENSELINPTEICQDMILVFYIFIKQLINICLVKHKFSAGVIKASRIEQNFKSLTSIIYWAVIKHFKSSLDLFRQIENPATFSDFNSERQIALKRVFYTNTGVHNIKERKYRKLCIDYEERHKGLLNASENLLLEKVLKKIPTETPDLESDEVEFLSKELVSEEKCEVFFEMAEKRGFNIIEYIDKWLIKIKEIIPEVDQKDI